MLNHIRDLSALESVAAFRALGSSTRVKTIELPSSNEMNIGELSLALGVTQPSVTKHVQILEEAGVFVSDDVDAPQGMQKRCRRVFERLLVDLAPKASDEDTLLEIESPIGIYADISVVHTCGMRALAYVQTWARAGKSGGAGPSPGGRRSATPARSGLRSDQGEGENRHARQVRRVDR